MVHLVASDLGVFIDYGRNQPGDVLQRFEAGRWAGYQPEGKPIQAPLDVNTLEPGRYRVVPSDR